MHINRFWKIVLVAILYSPAFILVFNQMLFGGSRNDMFPVYYLGAIGWGIFMSTFIIWIYVKSNNLKFTVMNKWTRKVSTKFLNRHYSNENERIIPMRGGVPIKVAPKGMFLVGLITDYDELAFIDLRPKLFSLTLTDTDKVATTDGVRIEGTIEITTKVIEQDKFLLRLISNEDEEEKILNSHIRKSVRKIISDKDWLDIIIFKENEYENIKQYILKDLKNVDCCFDVDEVTFINLAPIDKDFANLLEQKRKHREQAKFQEEKEISQQQRIKIENQTEAIRLEHEREKDKKEIQHQIDMSKQKSKAEIERLNEEHNAELKRKISENVERLKLIEKQAELLSKYPLILAEINPEAFKALNEKELKALELQLEKEKSSNKIIEQFALKSFDNDLARTKGQVDVFKAVATKQLGLDATIIMSHEKADSEKQNNEETNAESPKKETENLKNDDKNKIIEDDKK
ncbi:MAG: SPFH domain-containing protein [Draconibacterium sp.]